MTNMIPEVNPVAPWIINTLIALYPIGIGFSLGCFLVNTHKINALVLRVKALEKLVKK